MSNLIFKQLFWKVSRPEKRTHPFHFKNTELLAPP